MFQNKIKILLYFSILLISSCSPKINRIINYTIIKSENGKPDYNNLIYWAAHPWKWDPSDSIPATFKKDFKKDSSVDVFFIHPTTFLDKENNNWNATFEDTVLNKKTDYTTILYQASVFNEKCRIFSPRYRQAHIRAFYSSEKIKSAIAFEIAYTDIKKAFEYYLQNYNNGRPIILASHSQGTVHAARIIKEFIEGKPLQQKLICAYLIGMPTPKNYFSVLPACKDSMSTGCFLGWRTFQKGYIDTNYISKEKFECIVTNPLTWTTTEEYTPSKLNKGAILKNFNKLKVDVVDAQIHNNILWTCKPKIFGSIFLKQKNYHIADINFFYNNIRQNVETRIKYYYKQAINL